MPASTGPEIGEKRKPGARERKRQETRTRIVDVAVKLFGAQGYEATTVDAIAVAAGISRRTFFHYFGSKDDVLLSMQSGLGERIVAALADQPEGLAPLEAVRRAMMQLVAPYSTEELLAIDRLMRSSEAVQSRKQASYVRDEAKLHEALRARWPEESDASLRLVALLGIGLSRQSLDAWSSSGGARPLADYVADAFAALDGISGP